MSSSTSGPTSGPASGSVSEREQRRERRKEAKSNNRAQDRSVSPPRQRRPGLAALAVLLIVGGALLAGLLAVQLDDRSAVLVAKEDIDPGARITRADLATAQVATDSVPTIAADLANQVVGAYATTSIPANSLVEERMLSADQPVSGDKAIVAMDLVPALTPAADLMPGDLVQVVRVAGQNNSDDVREVCTALVLSVTQGGGEELGAQGSASASLLVPAQIAGQVIDASGAGAAGLALLERGQSTDVTLEVSQ